MKSNEMTQPVSSDVTTEAPKPSRKGIGGAPKNNVNSAIHMLRSSLAIGSVPTWMPGVRGAINRFRRGLESAVCEAHGQVSAAHAVLVNSATRAELRYLYAARAFRVNGEKASLADQKALWDT